MNNKENIKNEEKGRRAENENCRECADCENISMWTIVNKVDKQTTSFTKNSFPLDQEKDHCYGNEV